MSQHERSDSSTSTGSFDTGSPPPPPPPIMASPQQQQQQQSVSMLRPFLPRSASPDSESSSLSPVPSAPSTPANGTGSAVPSAPSSPPTRSAAGSQSSESGAGAGAARPVHFRVFAPPPPPPPPHTLPPPPPPPPVPVTSPLAAAREFTPPPPISTAQPSSSSSSSSSSTPAARRSRASSSSSEEPESPPPPPAPPSPMNSTPRTPSVAGRWTPPDSPVVEFVADPTSPQQTGLTVTTGTAPQFQLPASSNVVRVTGSTSMVSAATDATDPAVASPSSSSSVFQLKAAAPRVLPPPLPSSVKTAPVASAAGAASATPPASTSGSFPPPPPPPPPPNRSPPGSGSFPAAPSRQAPPSPAASSGSNGSGSGSFPPAPSRPAPTHSAQSSGEHPPPPPPPPPPKPVQAAAPSAASSPTSPSKAAAVAAAPLSSFHLQTSLQTIQTDTASCSASALATGESELLETRSSMIAISRRNFILERELQDIDEKIKLLIKNRLTIQEVMASSTGAPASASAGEGVLKNKRAYEELLFLLQSKPRYLALLSRLIQPRGDSIALFVQSVVFDIFGDSFDSYEERLLLSLFKQALQMEIDACTDRATLLRSNSAITQMLSAYAKRGQGFGILREILETPLKAICESRELRGLNLELQPLKLHQQIIMESETESGKRSHLDREVATDAEAALVPEVQALVAERVRQLEQCCDLILQPILDKVHSIPYGMRWICKMIGEIYRVKFGGAEDSTTAAAVAGAVVAAGDEAASANEGDAAAASSSSASAGPRSSPSTSSASAAAAASSTAAAAPAAAAPAPRSTLASQIQSLQGGYIYLRFFNPVIVAPDAMNFIREKPSRVLRRNLVLIAKVLQNLSNGVQFGAKEIYMQPLNAYIASRMPAMKTFFAALTAVDDVDESLDLEKYTHSTIAGGLGGGGGGSRGAGGQKQGGNNAITIQLNQIFAMHSLLLQFKEKLCLLARSQTYSAQDPLALILTKLGPTVPAAVPRAENVSVTLRLVDTRATRMSLWNSDGDGAAAPAASASAVSPTGGSAAVVHDPFQRGTSSAGSAADPLSNPLYMQAKNLLLSVLRRLPPEGAAEHATLLSYLTAQKAASLAAGDHALCDAVNNVCSMLSTLFNMRLLSPGPLAAGASPSQAREQAYDLFLQACSMDAASRLRARALLTKQRAMVDQALVTVSKHNAYLLGRLDVYRTYLVNVRQGQAQQVSSSGEQSSSKDKKKEKERADKEAASSSSSSSAAAAAAAKGGKKGSISEGSSGGGSLGSGSSGDPSKVDDFVKVLKYSHAELVDMQLIASIDGDISPKVLKALVFEVRMLAPRARSARGAVVVSVLAPRFFLSVSLKKGVSIPLLSTPFEIVLEDLLRLQEHATPTMTVETVHLNVNILVHLLNTQFIAAIPKS